MRALFPADPPAVTGVVAGIGSVLLLPELLTKPMRDGADGEVQALSALLARLGVVVTEHGVADLRGRTLRGRAEAMVAVADPAFRDELTRAMARHL